MSCIEYLKLTEVNPYGLLSLLNKKKVREHLVNHRLFDIETVKVWIKEKNKVDSSRGCRVRAILIDKQLAGWCGIQHDGENYEVAIILDDKYWGLGKKIFREVMLWAKEFGHQTIFIHFLYTRPEYRFLRKISKQVHISEFLGNNFTTYELDVNRVKWL
ncbi:MAG: GNAT family N-acetyltransferase [Gammaproteobacteria bacterium]